MIGCFCDKKVRAIIFPFALLSHEGHLFPKNFSQLSFSFHLVQIIKKVMPNSCLKGRQEQQQQQQNKMKQKKSR